MPAEMTEPLAETASFSFVVPAYNAEQTIGRAIHSVRAQTRSEWELIVVDDGSTDGTRAVADTVAEQDPRVRVVTQANAGSGAARNRGASEARTDLLVFFDADDTLDSTYLERMASLAGEHPEFSAYSCNAYHDYLDGTRILAYPTGAAPFCEISLAEEIGDSQVSMHSVVRRGAFEALGGFSPHYAEDYDFWLRFLAAGYRVVRIPQPLVVVDARPSGKSGVRERQLASIGEVLSALRSDATLGAATSRLLDRRIDEVADELALVSVKQRVRAGEYRGVRTAFVRHRRAMRYPRRLVVLALVLASPRLYRAVVLKIDPSVE